MVPQTSCGRKGRMKKPKSLFTTKKQSPRAWLSTSLGVISLVSVVTALYLTFRNGGAARLQYGAAVLLSFLFALGGFVLGVLSRREPDRFYLFSYLGMALNGVVLLLCAVILYYGLLP